MILMPCRHADSFRAMRVLRHVWYAWYDDAWWYYACAMLRYDIRWCHAIRCRAMRQRQMRAQDIRLLLCWWRRARARARAAPCRYDSAARARCAEKRRAQLFAVTARRICRRCRVMFTATYALPFSAFAAMLRLRALSLRAAGAPWCMARDSCRAQDVWYWCLRHESALIFATLFAIFFFFATALRHFLEYHFH